MERLLARIGHKARDLTQPPLLIVAFGDSVTQGAMEHERFDHDGVYHRRLQQELETFFPATTFSTLNAGVGGSTALQATERVSRDIIRHQPDLVLLAFGLNDAGGGLQALPTFEAALREIVTRVQTETEADLVLLTPPFMATRRTHRIHPDHRHFADALIATQNEGILAHYAESVRKISHEKQTALADIHAAWTRWQTAGIDTDAWLSNGLNHPDAPRHRLAAQLVFSALLEKIPSAA